MMNPFILTQLPTPPLVAGLSTSNGTANPFATPPSETGNPMVSFLSILDQATASFALPNSGLPQPATTDTAGISDKVTDDAGLNDLLTQLIQSLQQVQVQLPPEDQPAAQNTVDLLATLSETTAPTQTPDLKDLLAQLAPSLGQALHSIALAMPTQPSEASPEISLKSMPVDSALPDDITDVSQGPLVTTPTGNLVALIRTIQHMQKTLGTAPTLASRKANLDKLTQLVKALQANPETPPHLADKLNTLASVLDKAALPVVSPKLAHGVALQEALSQKLTKALDKAPDAFKPLIAETLAQLTAQVPKAPKTKESEKTIHPLQLELDLHRPLGHTTALTPVTEDTSSTEGFALRPEPVTLAASAESNSASASPISAGITPDHKTPITLDTTASVASTPSRESENLPPHLQVVQQAKMTIESGRKQVTMQLNPYDLGQVNLKITSHANNQVTIRLMTQTVEAHAALDQSVTQLVQSLEDQGVQIRNIQIVQAGQDMVSSTVQSQSMSQFDANTPDHREHRFEGNAQNQQQQQHQQQASAQAFSDNGSMSGQSQHLSNPFTDEGASMGEEIASSQIAFDTDVEGEEVTLNPSEPTPSASSGIDIRV